VTQKYVFLALNQKIRDLKLFISHTSVSDTDKNSQHLLVRNQCLTPYHIKINLMCQILLCLKGNHNGKT